MTGTDPLVHLKASLEIAASVVAQVDDDQWSEPTPCTEWDVAAVVSHLRDGTWWFAGMLGGPPPMGQPDPSAATALSAAGESLLAALSRPGALEETVTVPLGEVPATIALHLRATEALVHAWDVARATGIAFDGEDAVVAEALAFSQVAIEMIPPDRSPFGAPVTISDDAPPIDRLVALLGRNPAL